MRTRAARTSINILTVALLCLAGTSAHAQQEKSRFALRMGYFNDSFAGSGVVTKPFTDIMTLNIEYEFFQTGRESRVLRTVMAMDFASTKMMYFNAGYGQRYYIGGSGMRFARQEGNISMIAVPKIRYFVGFDAGIGQVIVNSISAVAQINSSVIDVGFDGGMTYAIGETMALSLSSGMSFGWGFSSVAVTGTTMHFLVGISQYL